VGLNMKSVKCKKADDNEVDAGQEIWSAIRYLDPDVERRSSDVAIGAAWIVVLLLIFVFIYLLPH
jgi:hypothetical protein